MSELEMFWEHLKEPEYVHVLLNPIPVYGLAMGILSLILALLVRRGPARVIALILILISTFSVWPVEVFGHEGYDRVYSMSYSDGQAWLKVHEERADRFLPLFYATAALAAAALVAHWKLPKAKLPLELTTLAASLFSLGIACWISFAGGQIRHREFRTGPPPGVSSSSENN